MTALNRPHLSSARASLAIGGVLYAVLLIVFWMAAQYFNMRARIAGHMFSTFVAFALILAPFWFFGFGLDLLLVQSIRSRASRALLPGVLAAPYCVFSILRSEFHLIYCWVFLLLPVLCAGLFELLPPAPHPNGKAQFCWQDFVVLSIFFLPVEFGWLRGAFPYSGLGALPKLILLDAALYVYLVVRRLEGIGYDFRLRTSDLAIGVRECLLYAPIAISLGILLHFLKPHSEIPTLSRTLGALLITFFFIAIPEELFFRGVLQNLLEQRLGHPRSWIIASLLFGLSHFNKPLPFNWRYVLLGSIAGLFYGRAWRDRHRLPASATTHTMVDVIWSLWFR